MRNPGVRKNHHVFMRYGMVCVILWLLTLLPVQVRAEEQVVRVGYYALDGYHMQDEDGHRSGYGYEFLQKVGRYLPYTYEYVGYDKSWQEMLEMLERGEIDILTSGGKTEEREKRYEYSENAIGTTVTMIAVKAGDERFVPKDYKTYQGARLGFLKNSYRNERFQEFAKEKGFEYEGVYYDTYSEMAEDLQTGVLDGIVSSNLRKLGNEWVIEQFDHNDFYVMAPKGEREILDEIDAAIELLDRDEPGWRTSLMHKSYMEYDEENISLTREEQEYIDALKEQKTVLKVLVNPDRSPYSYFENGEAKGIIPAIFERAAGQLGIAYEVLETGSREEYYQKLEAGEADICMDCGSDYSEAEEIGFEITDAYMSTGFSKITRRDFTGEMKSIASMEKPFLLTEYLEDHFAGKEIRYYDSIEECVNAVEKGEADAAFFYTYTVQEIMNEDFYDRFVSGIMGGGYVSFSIGVRRDCDSNLLTSLNKVMGRIKNTEAESIILEKTEHLHQEQGLREFLYRNPLYGMLLVAASILFLCIAAIAVISKKNQKKLQAAYDKLRAANNVKRDFFSKMSHDIRTPMNAIIGMTEVVERNASDQKTVREYVEKMRVSEQYMLTMLNQILDMSQIEDGTLMIKKQPFLIRNMLEETAVMVRPLSDAKKQKFTVDLEGIPDRNVNGDFRKIQQVLLNLLGNAVKYTQTGGEICLKAFAEPDDVFCFQVKDNGMGIPEQYQTMVYEAFFRAEDSRVSRVQGTGLGLTIVRAFVELMDGNIRMESKEGSGTEFTVRIPLEILPEEPKKEEAKPEPAEKCEEQGMLHGLRLLLVEDNELNREIALVLLEDMGVSVDWAENGMDGVEKFQASEEGFYDVILMDLQMPVMNGLEASRRIRGSHRKDAGLPVFALSANSGSEDVQASVEAGMNAHISKPIDVKELYGHLKEIYDRKNGKQE